jgi:glycine/D-amino acid oxidase-like deaminating enzyme
MGPAGPKGVVVATGHHRNGILLAPVTAALIACYVKDGTHDPALERFAANRFEGIADHNMKESVS